MQAYDDVKGVSTNIFFISHTKEEHRDDELKSMSNEHEATYLVALCNYLILQGYSPSQVTTVAAYRSPVLSNDNSILNAVAKIFRCFVSVYVT